MGYVSKVMKNARHGSCLTMFLGLVVLVIIACGILFISQSGRSPVPSSPPVAASPSPQPAQPTSPPAITPKPAIAQTADLLESQLMSAQAALNSARQQVNDARSTCIDSIKNRPDYSSAIAKAKSAEAVVKESRRSNDDKRIADASKTWMDAKNVAGKIETTALRADKNYQAALGIESKAGREVDRLVLLVRENAKKVDDERNAKLKELANKIAAANRPLSTSCETGDIGILSGGFTIIQIVDSSTALIEWENQIFLLTDISTRGLVDGRQMGYASPVRVTGTQTYATVLGSRTVFVLQPHEISMR